MYLAAIAREQQVTWFGKHLLRHIGYLRRPPKSRRLVQKNTCRSFDRQALKNDLGSENLVHPLPPAADQERQTSEANKKAAGRLRNGSEPERRVLTRDSRWLECEGVEIPQEWSCRSVVHEDR